MTRYYPNNISIEETNIIGYIRQDVTRQIISFILENDQCTFDEIVEHAKKAPSTVAIVVKSIFSTSIITET